MEILNKMSADELRARIRAAMEKIEMYGQIGGAHHKAWVLDQLARLFYGDLYEEWVEAMKEDGKYDYDEGIAP